MKNKFSFLCILNPILILQSCKKSQSFTKIDDSYTMTLKYEFNYSNGHRTMYVNIKEYDELKNEIIKLTNNISNYKYKDTNKINSINGGPYNFYSVVFSKENNDVLEFSYSKRDNTFIYDFDNKISIKFKNTSYNYSVLNKLREKLLYLYENIPSKHKEVNEVII